MNIGGGPGSGVDLPSRRRVKWPRKSHGGGGGQMADLVDCSEKDPRERIGGAHCGSWFHGEIRRGWVRQTGGGGA